jgi:triosephosphate isomerase
MKPFLYVANWKMQLSYAQTMHYANKYKNNFIDLAQKKNIKIILCPSFDSLDAVNKLFNTSTVLVGAQQCSSQVSGAYTGQVSAESLHDLGIRYCLVGHSEQRRYLYEKDEQIAQKVEILMHRGITPIVCIGANRADESIDQVYTSLMYQIETAIAPILISLQTMKITSPICFAYEPLWAIGTGNVPSLDYLNAIFMKLENKLSTIMPASRYFLLYGGSVDATHAPGIKSIKSINGLLIGGSSLNFQKFQNIVLS